MKKIVAIAAAGVLALCLAGCGDGAQQGGETASNGASDSAGWQADEPTDPFDIAMKNITESNLPNLDPSSEEGKQQIRDYLSSDAMQYRNSIFEFINMSLDAAADMDTDKAQDAEEYGSILCEKVINQKDIPVSCSGVHIANVTMAKNAEEAIAAYSHAAKTDDQTEANRLIAEGNAAVKKYTAATETFQAEVEKLNSYIQ
ncbi:hypothetical protein [uncultured Senegalimassilia sp.]|uniref:hypothetical protein n=1 Tax=uncultured Senegalimassilia sp. TaxID=1714350 RepID=UPI002600F4DD|nr:hypothetical protein [uncultured Senegalimassilia sp.]